MRLRSLRSLFYGARDRHSAVLTIRLGSRVERHRFGSLDDALDELAERVRDAWREGPLDEVSMIRKFAPERRVAARLEISTGGFLRKLDAGIDVMGDGTLVAYRGGMGRRELERGHDLDEALSAVRTVLA